MTYHYATSLCWARGHGVARHDGLSIALRRRPPIPGLGEYEAMRYEPGTMHTRIVRAGRNSWEDMTDDEQACVRQWLIWWTSCARKKAESCKRTTSSA